MSLAVVVRLRNGRYDAAGLRPDEPEWPPHPARLFCALTASAMHDADWTALRWLESLPAPEVWASSLAAVTVRSGYVVTNTRHGKTTGLSQSWPARTNGVRNRAGVVPATGDFAVVWPGAGPDDAVAATLSRLARRVPYIGRSTSPAIASVQTALPEAGEDWSRWQPVPAGTRGSAGLRIPYPGYTDQLETAYADGRRSWEAGRTAAYAIVGGQQESRQQEAPGPFGELIVFGFDRKAAMLHGRSALTLTVALRRALMSRIATGVPAPVSGHGADDRTHVAYLALPDVGHEHADGHLLGVALGLPASMHGDELARVLSASVDDPLRRLRIQRGYEIGLNHDPFRSSPRGLLPERWTAAARTWVTATPLMLDRHPHGKSTVIDEVTWSLRRAGYPEPSDVEVSPAAMISGAVHRVDLMPIPIRGPKRPVLHARVTFPEPVTGPVIAGALKYFGVGLFAPVKDIR